MSATKSPFLGTWEGRLNDLPALDLSISEKGGQIGGVIWFHFQRRGADGKWHVEGDKYAQPLLLPKVEGKNLTFEVVHHRTHGSPDLGPNARFRMELIGPNAAMLYKLDDNPPPPPLKLIHK